MSSSHFVSVQAVLSPIWLKDFLATWLYNKVTGGDQGNEYAHISIKSKAPSPTKNEDRVTLE